MFFDKYFNPKNSTLQTLSLSSEGTSTLKIPEFIDLISSEFERLGSDLIIISSSGERFLIADYFKAQHLLDLKGADGSLFPGSIIKILAGSVAPLQYAQNTPGQGSPQVGIVETLEGSVFATRLNGARIQLSEGDPVFQGDVLETSDDGVIGITFEDQSSLSLDQNAQLVIDEMVYDPEADTGNGALFLIQGAMSFVSGSISKTSPDAMLINSPIATVGIRGTSVVLSVTPPSQPGGSPRLSVVMVPELNEQGQEIVGETILVTSAGSRILSDAFNGSVVESPDQLPSEPVTVSLNELGQVFGTVLRANPNPNTIPPEVRDIVDKFVDQEEAQETKDQAEENVQQARENAEKAEAEAQNANAAATAAQEEAEALFAQTLGENLSEDELLELQAAAQEAQELAAELAFSAAELTEIAQNAITSLVEAEQELTQATEELTETTNAVQVAVNSYVENTGVQELAGTSNLTGSNTNTGNTTQGETATTNNPVTAQTDVTPDVSEPIDFTQPEPEPIITTETVLTSTPDLETETQQADEDDNEDDQINNDPQNSNNGGSLEVQNALSSENGTGSRVDLGSLSTYTGGGNLNVFTVEAWIKVPAVGPRNGVGVFATDSSSNSWFQIQTVNTSDVIQMRVEARNGTTPVVTSQTTLTPDTWTHFAVVNDGVSFTMYFDGVQDPNSTSDVAMRADRTLWIAANRLGSGSIENIAEFRFWNVDKSADIANQSYRENQLDGSEAGLLAYVPLDQISGDSTTEKVTGNALSVNGTEGTNYDWISNGPELFTGSDPIVFDLNGDGIDLLGTESGVMFDVNADGLLERTGWIGPGDGILVLDRNEDGLINDMSEVVSHYFDYEARNVNGLMSSRDVLALYDDNQDQLIDKNDSIFDKLRIWQDGNQDGLTDQGELMGLEALGIPSISLEMTTLNTFLNGNRVTGSGFATSETGNALQWKEVLFQKEQENEQTHSHNEEFPSYSSVEAIPATPVYDPSSSGSTEHLS